MAGAASPVSHTGAPITWSTAAITGYISEQSPHLENEHIFNKTLNVIFPLRRAAIASSRINMMQYQQNETGI